MAAKNIQGTSRADERDIDRLLHSAPGASAVTRLSAVETVRARILLSVEHGLLVPGGKLPGTELIAAGLEVSVITARRGLESLVEDGVLERRRGRGGGTFVAQHPPKLQDDAVRAYLDDVPAVLRLIDQRSLMESAIAAQAALNASGAQCLELEDLIGQSARAMNWHEHHIPDTRFHRRVAEISALPEVPAYLFCYESLLKYFVPYPQEQLEEGRTHHQRLVDAFRARDPLAAIDVTREHVDALRREMFFGLPGGNATEPGTAP
ncbi:FCD domain-containing protein [Glutamicibacter mishrai]|uniref:FadR/GntR family transcriptional regulator n=1 Tax=Glutamicibacter mishrai TaxID=1775880 RepID=UPI0020CDF9C6|nr:FCD domain-containing protein [Glutamicibacter mishrai]UTT39414.1 FCD domain-containing protein [Glutamicibacter mishrai]